MQNVFDVVQTRSGNAIAGAFVYVYNSSNVLATLYSDNGVTTTANPLTTNSDGEYQFYAANGTYSIVIAATGYDGQTINGKVLFDPADAIPLSVKNFGAKGDGVTDDSAAVTTMAATVGYVVFSAGTFAVNLDIALSVPVQFYQNALVSIASSKTITFNNTITAERQRIFTGAGSVLLSGEISHYAKPEWFGAFPDQPALNCATGLQALSNSVIASRECVIDMGVGTYYLQSGVSWSRACRIVGQGYRITHFRCTAALATGNVFTTAGEGVEFQNIQFSCASTRTSGSYILFSHNYCVADGIWLTDSFGGIDVQGNVCRVQDVTGFTSSSAAGSFIVRLGSGFNTATVDNVVYIDTAGTSVPKYLVRVDNHEQAYIGSLYGRGVDVVLGIVPASGTARNIAVDSVKAQSPTVTSVLIQSTGTGAVENVSIDKIQADAVGTGLKIQKDGSGICKYLNFGKIDVRAFTTAGVVVDASTGSVDHWSISQGSVRNGTGTGVAIANADYWVINGLQSISNSATGTTIASGCVGFVYTGNVNLFNTTAQLTDSSGAVTKVITNNI